MLFLEENFMRLLRFLIVLVNISFCFLTFSQEDDLNCSFLKEKKNRLKSATLSFFDIQRTEKYDVTSYVFDLIVSHKTAHISGSVQMNAFAKEDIDTVVLELFEGYSINTIKVNENNVTTFVRRKSGIFIPLISNVNDRFSIEIKYQGNAPDQTTNPLGGSGLTHEYSDEWNKDVSYTLSEPFSAYEWWPCKQSLADKIDSVDMYLTIPKECLAGSNGILVKTESISESMKKLHWKHRYPIDYYLISFAVAEYMDYSYRVKLPGVKDSLLIQNYIYSDSSLYKSVKSKIDLTGEYMQLFSELFGGYPFANEKYGHCMATLGGGMEHQTMTTILNFDKNLVSHELAHQWWGNHVTCGSWTDIWLNEGFARYCEFVMLEKLFPGEEKLKMEKLHANVLKYETGSVWVKDSLNTNRIFSGAFTYDKGASIIHTLRSIIHNDDLFFNTLKQFQNSFGGKVASAKDFKDFVEQKTNVNLTDFFNEWYYGEGYPIYAIKLRTYDDHQELLVGHEGSAITTPLFTNPIEISFKRENMKDTIIRFSINSNHEKFILPKTLKISHADQIDPNNFVLNKVKEYPLLIDTSNVNYVLFPNPSNSVMNLEMKNPGPYQLIIYSMDGVKMDEYALTKELEMNISSYPVGYYIAEIKKLNSEETITLRFEKR